MKNKIIPLMLMFFLMALNVYSQDTTHASRSKKQIESYQGNGNENSYTYKPGNKPSKKITKKPMYRDTRLGGSSKKYNTYKKNDNGAGAITTTPKK